MRQGASFNARLNTPQRGQRKPVATAPGRFRDAGGMPESELGGQDSLDVHSYDEDADLADGEYPPRCVFVSIARGRMLPATAAGLLM